MLLPLRSAGHSALIGFVALALFAAPVAADVFGPGTWDRMPPPDRWLHPLAYDAAGDRAILFGGLSTGGFTNETWELRLRPTPHWKRMIADGTRPGGRHSHTAIHDALENRVIVFAGFGSGRMNDVWELDLDGVPSWNQLAPAGTPPEIVQSHSAIYDPPRQRMIVFGGFTNSGETDALWELSLGATPTWSVLAASGAAPSPRSDHTAIYDPVGDRMLVYGGDTSDPAVWQLTLSGTETWSQLATAGGPPTGRFGHSAVHDASRNRMLVYGGSGVAEQLWELDLSGTPTWTQLAPAAGGLPPAPHTFHAAFFDLSGNRMFVHGGSVPDEILSETWALVEPVPGNPAWQRWTPTYRSAHSAIHDPVRDRMIVFGGNRDGTRTNTTWAYSLDGIPIWSLPDVEGAFVAPRDQHGAMYDPAGDAMIVFGGETDAGLSDEIWSLSMAAPETWSAISAGSGPSARRSHAVAHDTARNRMIVFGGWDGGRTNDVWALSLGGSPSWTQLLPTGTPPSAREEASAVYDPGRDRIVVFGGRDDVGLSDEVWALTLSGTPAWTLLATQGSGPNPRAKHAAVFDPTRDCMLVYAGESATASFNDLYELAFGVDPPDWTFLLPAKSQPAFDSPDAREDHSAVLDPLHERVIVYAGFNDLLDDFLSDVWQHRLSAVVAVGEEPAPGLRLGPAMPNPTRGATSLALVLPRAMPVTADVLDLRGRRVRRLVDRTLPAGRAELRWDGTATGGERAASGIYFVRVRAGDEAFRGKLVLLP